MLLYDKKSPVSLCEKYISKIEQIIYKNDTAEYKYKKLLLLKFEFEGIKTYNKLPYDYEKFISYFINWNLEFYGRCINKNKIITKGNPENVFYNLLNVKMQ